MTVREMVENDIPAVVKIEQECFTAEAWSEESFRYRLGKPGFISLVAVDNGEVVGYIAASEILDEQYLDSLAVRADYRGQGIATSLMKEAFDEEKTVYLEVRKSNLPAIGLYKKLGFTQYAERRDYYDNPTENAILMRNENLR
ncbi:MAG: ribosomal protein S18-alanine N-acetyltransferase [Oscillospiraceae bacterium]|nr:ribosomal protein S18-alanine N-acetyltransferase [Oscillospiraceae bacterium]